MSRPRLIALLLALTTLVVYLPVTRHDFVDYDDGDYITNNDMVQQGLTLTGVGWAFTTFHAANWHPLTWLSHMADCQFFQLNAGAHHFVNALFHAVNTALLFILLWQLTGRLSPATVVAALFGWHPLHVESVAWASERKDVLSTFFGLLALLAYAKYVKVRDQRSEVRSPWSVVRSLSGTCPLPSSLFNLPPSTFYFLSLACFALGLLAKPMLVTFPFILLLLDYWPLGRFSHSLSFVATRPPTLRFGAASPLPSGSAATSAPRIAAKFVQNARSQEDSARPLFPLPASLFAACWQLALEKWPFFLLSVGSCAVTFLAQRAGYAVASLDLVPMSYRLENAAVAIGWYLLKMPWPANLAIIYPATPLSVTSVSLACAALILISTAVWLARHRSPYWLTGWLWFLGALMPVIGLVPIGGAAMADRYTYFPSIGIFTAVVFGFHELAWARKFFPWLVALPLLACVILTERQLACWRNGETLFRHAIAVTGSNELAWLNLGATLERQNRLPEALQAYREAARISPTHYRTRFEIGNLLVKMGQPTAALAEYQECVTRFPQFPVLHNAAGIALAAQGDIATARLEFAAAAKLDPHYAQPHLELAKILLQQGLSRPAVDELRAAVRAQPDDWHTLAAAARYLAASADDAARDGAGALTLALQAGELSQNRQPEVFDVLGMAFATTGDFSNAVTCAQNALAFLPPAKQKELEEIQQHLKQYQNRQPWRESFRGTNAAPASGLSQKD